VLEVLASGLRQENEIKGINIRQEEMKRFLISYNMVIDTENPKILLKFLELIN
jgi:hypothetical protein